jgi:acyl-[acyl carrier protein]--UDP-N-acetylglucosamine O-acyltransferase
VVSVVEWPGYEGVEVVVNAQEFLGEGLQMVQMSRVGQNHIIIRIYGVHTIFLAGKSAYIRSYTVCIYSSGQPYR